MLPIVPGYHFIIYDIMISFMRRLQLIVSDKVREENSLARETSLYSS